MDSTGVGQQSEGVQPSEAPKGYLSEEHKRRFTVTVGILGGLCIVAQFVLPFVVFLGSAPFVMMTDRSFFRLADLDSATYWNDSIWCVERITGPGADGEHGFVLRRMVIGPDGPSEAEPEEVAELPFKADHLLADGDRMWMVSASVVGAYSDGLVEVLQDGLVIGDTSRPFLHAGRLSAVRHTPTAVEVVSFDDGAWNVMFPLDARLPDDCSDCFARRFQVVSDGAGIHVFFQQGETVFYRQEPQGAESAAAEWEPVTKVASSGWRAVWEGSAPAVWFSRREPGERGVVVTRRNAEGWQEQTFDLAPRMYSCGYVPLEPPSRMAILTEGFPGSLRVSILDGDQPVVTARYGRSSPFPPRMMALVLVPHLVSYSLPLVLALILTGMMRTNRVTRHVAGDESAPYASLARRAGAQVIDGIILGGPAAVGFFMAMGSMFDVLEIDVPDPWAMLSGFGLVFAGLAWALVGLVLIAIAEGVWGVSPGKWVVGIRVLGTDLEPCGVPRALVRNLLKFVDGFFHFLVGVLLVALTESWQRVGDMAARTVVIDVRAG